ncbi:MAG: DNA repair protein RadA [Propionibacteriaceae bacterium]|nr:DNA repair protein RadA [Propionibacteriaceae bacterium]
MARALKTSPYRCSECGWTTAKWVGRCGECQAWGSVSEAGAPRVREVAAQAPAARAVPIASVAAELTERDLTGVAELDRVLGGGLVPGAVVLLAGEPGVGKSTLLLEVAARWAAAGRRTLYVTGEESAAQVRLRAGRTGALADELFLAAETDLGTILGHVDEVGPSLLVLDSVQTVSTAEADGAPGGVTQVRETTGALVRVAKRSPMAVIIVGHVTKEGTIAGPRTMEHLVDVVLNFEGDRHSGFRMVRAAKNRFGPADEVGCFEMTDEGIVEVPDPSGLFTSQHAEAVPGTCLTVTMEGRRPLLAEIQALVAPSPAQQNPRRVSQGLENARVTMLTAVLQRRAGIELHNRDIYVATVGGARIFDPAADLASALAIASAAKDRPVMGPRGVNRLVAIGEVGLAGELRRVPGLERRIAEAARLGFDTAVVPAERGAEPRRRAVRGMRVVECTTLPHALAEALSPAPLHNED